MRTEIASFSQTDGFDAEYWLTVTIYEGTINYLQDLDPQWTHTAKTVRQKWTDFLASGPPDMSFWTPKPELQEQMRAVILKHLEHR